MFGESDRHIQTVLCITPSKNAFHTDRLDIVANCDLHTLTHTSDMWARRLGRGRDEH